MMEKYTHNPRTFNDVFQPGKITFVIDNSFGSSGKGKICASLIKYSDNVSFISGCNSPNASHWTQDTLSDGTSFEYCFKVLPSASYMHHKLDKIFLCQGSSFAIKDLLKEISDLGIPREKLRIHYKAGIISQQDCDFEAGLCDFDGNYYEQRHDGTIKSGSTCSGSGALLAKKAVRKPSQKIYAYEYPELSEFLCDTEQEIMILLDSGKSGLHEIAQGFPLSNGLSFNKRHCTSRNVTVCAALNDMLIPPYYCGNVVINTRTHAIRINSKKAIPKYHSITINKVKDCGEYYEFDKMGD